MAITKEKLEELIEKGVEIYSIYESPFDKPCVSYIELDRDWFFEIENGNLEIRGYDIVGDEFLTDHSLDKLFETKAEAEFCAKYKNIQRTETLDLPTWEEAKIDKLVQNGKLKNGCWDLIKSFTDKMNNEMFEFSLSSDNGKKFYLSVNNEDSSYKDLFYKPLTYENYLEACELCKKLFEGEEV